MTLLGGCLTMRVQHVPSYVSRVGGTGPGTGPEQDQDRIYCLPYYRTGRRKRSGPTEIERRNQVCDGPVPVPVPAIRMRSYPGRVAPYPAN